MAIIILTQLGLQKFELKKAKGILVVVVK